MSCADTVNTWFAERLACGPLARDTEAFNQVVAALPALIGAIDGPGATTPSTADANDPAPAKATAAKGATAD